jgi:hypothetical protein
MYSFLCVTKWIWIVIYEHRTQKVGLHLYHGIVRGHDYIILGDSWTE